MRSVEEITAGLVLGRYECLMPIARGGQAAVWAARVTGARGFEKIVAVKAMLPGLVHDSNFERMFLDEARIASNVKHPNVVEILDLGEHGNLLYLVMEFVEGETLYDLIHLARKKGIPGPIAIKIVMDVCSGLHAAHELKENGVALELVHRDVSPQNVMISESGIVKILDFGVARIKNRMSQATAAGHVKGKTNYLSPEQVAGKSIDRRTDLFALGVILYQLTTGSHPFAGDTEGQTLNAIMRCRFKRPSEVVSGYPEALENVVLRALEREPEFRFQTAQDLYKALDGVLATMSRPTSEELAAFIRPIIQERVAAFRESLQQCRKPASKVEPAPGASQEGGGRGVGDAPGALEVAAPAWPPIVHTPTAGGGSSLSAAPAVPVRKRLVPLVLVLGALLVAGALFALGGRLLGTRSTLPAGPASAVASPQSATPSAPDLELAVSASASAMPEPIASASSSAPGEPLAVPKATVRSKGGARAIPPRNKPDPGKKWTPPVTESGL